MLKTVLIPTENSDTWNFNQKTPAPWTSLELWQAALKGPRSQRKQSAGMNEPMADLCDGTNAAMVDLRRLLRT